MIMEWIKVEESMPPYGEDVLAYFIGGYIRVASVSICGNYDDWISYEEGVLDICDPTHWMPLPEPPKQ